MGLRDKGDDLVEQGESEGLGVVGEVPREVERWIPDRDGKLLLDVLRDVNAHGARVTEGGEEYCFSYDTIDVENEVVVLGDSEGNLHDGGLLEGVGADHLTGDLASDGNHWDEVKEGIDEAGV